MDREGNLAKTISFDIENEEFLEVSLQGYKNDLFQIKAISNSFNVEFNKDNTYNKLWVNNSHLEVFLPDHTGKVNIYSNASENSEILHKINLLQPYTIQPIKCCKNWIFGIYTDKNKKETKGWFHPNDICSSPLTNC